MKSVISGTAGMASWPDVAGAKCERLFELVVSAVSMGGNP
jgi:hypothetical protein